MVSARIEVSLNANVSENTPPFVSQPRNNFSDYDKPQSVDRECPSLYPHILLLIFNKREWNILVLLDTKHQNK